MNNWNLAQNIKNLRNKSGMSQEILAEESGLSLRTIQRIENDETVPRGDTLTRLAKVLKTSPDEIMDWKIQEDQKYLALISLYSLGFLVFPLLGIIIPLAMWVLNKDKIKNVNELGKSILNYQITWTIILSLYLIFASILDSNRLGSLFIATPIIFLYLFNFIVTIMNTIRISNNKRFIYPPSLAILK